MKNIIREDDWQLGMGLEERPAGREESSLAEGAGGGAAEEGAWAVRLRRPERRQMAWVAQCPDDLVSATHPVRRVAEVVEHLDVSGFCQPIKAREGVAGRDATDPKLLVSLWLYACVRGIGSARELARQCEENAAFRWLCGGVSVNHRLLSDFRTDHGEALDQLLTQVVASLVDRDVVKVSRVSQDGVRVRVGAGASSFRREARLEKLLEEAKRHVEELHRRLDSPASPAAAITARQAAARKRAAREKQERLQQAIAQLPELKRRQEEAARRAGQGKCGEKIREKEPRVSTTDAEARVEDAERGIQPGGERAAGDRHRQPGACGGGGEQPRFGLGGVERADAAAGGKAHRRQGGRTPPGWRVPAERGPRGGPPAGRGPVRAAQAGEKSAEAGAGIGAEGGR